MISDIVWSYDVNARGECIGSYISPVADRMLGLPDGTIGNSMDEYLSYVHPDDLPEVHEVLSKGIESACERRNSGISPAKGRWYCDLGQVQRFSVRPTGRPHHRLWNHNRCNRTQAG